MARRLGLNGVTHRSSSTASICSQGRSPYSRSSGATRASVRSESLRCTGPSSREVGHELIRLMRAEDRHWAWAVRSAVFERQEGPRHFAGLEVQVTSVNRRPDEYARCG